MAGYTRQSTASIINGSSITAPPINAEFNQLLAAFNAASGHGHTGGTGDAPKISLTTSVSGYLPLVHGGVGGRNNVTNSVPTANDDSGDGYAPGSIWENSATGRVYICVGNSSGAAVWRELVQVDSGNAILPASNNIVDLGNNSTRFQDLFLSGGISASGNVAIGGTLTTVGTSAFTGLATFANLSATGTTTITSVDLNSGAIDNAVIGSATPAAGTFTTLNANTSLVAATADINGGTIDGAALGATTPSTGSFTTLGASGTSTLATVDINGGNIDGTVIGASTVAAGSFTTLSTTGQATLASADINGGSIDGSTIGANSTSTGAFTTLTASGGITGSLTGNVTGNTAGVHTGNVAGDVTGNLTGNVTASSGTSTFTNLVVNGNLNMNAGTSATITNLTAPSSDLDAATKKYVDDEISTLVGDAGAGLDTLGELADALNDDDAFSTTVTNSIATKLPKAGGTMTGAIAMSTNKITGVGNPTSAQDVSTKVYTDTQRDTRVAKTGDTMSGALAMGNNKITGLGTPTATTDATTKTYVDGLFQSTTAAATSATNAATSETNAATSETIASVQAAAASVSQNAAAQTLTTFQNQYLGAQSSAPTQDPDGSALDVGDLYFDTVANAMKVYSSSGWTNAGSSVNGTSNRVTYTATAGQTVFAATYDSGYIDVYLNGVKLLAGTDFTATNGTSITLASGASVNDVVDIVAYGTFELADHYTRTASDARYVEVAGDTMTGNLSFGDNDKAIFGAGSDLQIYHDGSNSRIQDTATGSLILAGTNFYVNNTGDSKSYLAGLDGGTTPYVRLYYDGATRLDTTSTGIDVTGTATMGQLTAKVSSYGTKLTYSNSNQSGIIDTYGNHNLEFRSNNDRAMNIASNGDISFYEDTGTTAKFFWDASAERLGLGTSSPSEKLHVQGDGADILLTDLGGGQTAKLGSTGSNNGLLELNNSSHTSKVFLNTSGDSYFNGGNVGIGDTVPTNGYLTIRGASTSGTANSHIMLTGDSATVGQGPQIAFSESGGSSNWVGASIGFERVGGGSVGDLIFSTRGTLGTANSVPSERMRIGSDGETTFQKNLVLSGGLGATNGITAVEIFNSAGMTYNTFGSMYSTGATMIGRGVEPKNGGAGYVSSITANTTRASMEVGANTILFKGSGAVNTSRGDTVTMTEYAAIDSDGIKLPSGKGIKFSAYGSGNILSDYEEGSFNFGILTGSLGTASKGKYTKIGNSVTIYAQIDAATDFTTSAAIYLTGLPFVAQTPHTTGHAGQGAVSYADGMGNNVISAVARSGYGHVFFSNLNTGTTTHSDCTRSWNVRFTLSYFTNS